MRRQERRRAPIANGHGAAERAGTRSGVRIALAVLLALAVPLALVPARPVRAQDTGPPDTTARAGAAAAVPDSLSPDSLAARLARAEAAIALLRRQLGVEAQSAVRARSRFELELFGTVLTSAFRTAGGANAADVPLIAMPAAPGEEEPVALGMTLRQTRLGAALSVADVLGGSFHGDIEFDLFGGGSGGERPFYPEARLRTAHARLVWARTELMIGSSRPLVSDLTPVSVVAVGAPEFAAAGNLWAWLAQARLTREVGTIPLGDGGVRIALQGAVLAPYAGIGYSGGYEPRYDDEVDAAERSGRPSLQGRLRARWGEDAAAPSDMMRGSPGGEVGVGVHRGWVATEGGAMHRSRAVTVDAVLAPASFLELRAEAYAGELVRGLGGGAIGQSFGAPATGEALGAPIRNVAGWAQLNVQPHALLVAGAGCGVDDPDDDDRPLRLRNAACATHLLWRPVQPIVVGLEYRQLRTRHAAGTARVDHVGLAFGVEF